MPRSKHRRRMAVYAAKAIREKYSSVEDFLAYLYGASEPPYNSAQQRIATLLKNAEKSLENSVENPHKL